MAFKVKSTPLIFQEPPENIDETWTHGAMLGGMCGYDNDSLAAQYFRAGSALVKHVLSSGERGQDMIGPILYLYRHGVELYLKVILKPEKPSHNLGSLLDAFCRHIRERYNQQVPKWVTRPISELAQADPGSDLFRYGDSRSRPALDEGGEYWIDLRVLSRIMLELEYAFERVLVAEEFGLEYLKTTFRGPRLGDEL